MFRVSPMCRVLLLVPRADLDAAIDEVGALGALHLLDLAGREDWVGGVRASDVAESRRERLDALRRLEALTRFYAAPPPRGLEAAPLLDVIDVEQQLGQWSAEMESLRSERTQLRDEIERLEHELRAVRALAPSSVNISAVRAMRFLVGECGWLEQTEVGRLEESLARIPHRVVPLERTAEGQLVFAFAPSRERETLERALRAVGFERLELPADASGIAGDATRPLEAKLEQAQAALRELDERFERARHDLALPLARARTAIERSLLSLEAQALAQRSESISFISGWVPRTQVDALRAALRRATGGRCYVRVEEPQSIDSVVTRREAVPILLRNPALFRPFERMVGAFGTPRWGELDPTPLVATAFWIMFGLMFGDVGQGAVVAMAGWWIFRHIPRYRDYGVILMECGFSAVAFGFAYGSVFGREDLLPALWFRPLGDVARLLRIGIAFGLAFLSLGLALSVLNSILRRDWAAAWWGPQGLLSASSYWIGAALALRWLASGRMGVRAGVAAALLGAPLALLWAMRAWTELREEREDGSGGSGLVAAVLHSAVELVDLIVRSIANTVSFVRLAAFAVAHAGLLVAVFALAQTVAAAPAGRLWGFVVIVAGNLVVIALEGMIVSIQAVRLVYYEFFSKFYEGSGLAYRPLRLLPHGASKEQA